MGQVDLKMAGFHMPPQTPEGTVAWFLIIVILAKIVILLLQSPP